MHLISLYIWILDDVINENQAGAGLTPLGIFIGRPRYVWTSPKGARPAPNCFGILRVPATQNHGGMIYCNTYATWRFYGSGYGTK